MGQNSSVEQRRLHKYTRNIVKDYQFLTLFLHDRIEKQDPSGCTKSGVPARRAFFSGTLQLSLQLREMRASLESLSYGNFTSPEARRSRLIDRQLREEQLQPWTRSVCVMMPQGTQRLGLFKPSLTAFICEDKQKYMAGLRDEALRHMHRLLGDAKCLDEIYMPREARLLAMELRTRVKETADTLTEEELDLFERLWSFKAFTSIANDIEGGSWVNNASLVTNV